MRAGWALGLVGCATATTLGSPRTLAPGRVAPAVTLDLGWAADARVAQPQLRATVGGRVGLGRRTDLGLRVGGLPAPRGSSYVHLGADAKWQLARTDRRAVALGLGVEFDRVGIGGVLMHGFAAQVPVLMGWSTGEQAELRFTPRVVVQRAWGDGATPITKGLIGMSGGVAYPVGRSAALVPTFGILWGLTHAESDARLQPLWVPQLGLAWEGR
ncbi:MAG: hypothetical protein AAGA48_31085 [Myxococcota bacterium]